MEALGIEPRTCGLKARYSTAELYFLYTHIRLEGLEPSTVRLAIALSSTESRKL